MAAGLRVVDTSAWIEWLSIIFFCQARDFNLDNPAITEAIHQDVCTAFAEDRPMIEAQVKVARSVPAAGCSGRTGRSGVA